ncbi:hypothetical protein ABC304_11410 [Microbacterium sp. 1P10UB]
MSDQQTVTVPSSEQARPVLQPISDEKNLLNTDAEGSCCGGGSCSV